MNGRGGFIKKYIYLYHISLFPCKKFQFLLQKLGRILLSFPKSKKQKKNKTDGYNIIGHFTVVYLVAKSLIWSEAEGHLVVIETSI